MSPESGDRPKADLGSGAESALIAARLDLALRSGRLGLFDLDPDREVVALDVQARSILGIAVDATLSVAQWRALIHPDDLSAVDQALSQLGQAVAGEIMVIDFRLRLPSEGWRWIRASSAMRRDRGARRGTLGTVQDISTLKTLEADRLESSERFRLLVDNLDDVFWIVDARRHRQLYVSPSYSRVWGLDASELMRGAPRWAEAIHPSDRAEVQQIFEATASGETGSFTAEYRLQFGDGRLRWIRDRGVAVRDDRGQIDRVIGIAEDITERRTVIRALVEREERLKLAVAAANLHVWTFDLRSRRFSLADELCAMLGLPPERCRRLGPWRRRVHPEDRPMLEAAMKGLIAGGPAIDVEFRVLRPADAVLTWLSLRAILLPDEDGMPATVHGVCTDVTERTRHREQLRERGERLALALTAARMCTWTLDLKTRDVIHGDDFRTLIGLHDDEPVTRDSWFSRIHPDDQEDVRTAFQTAVETRQRLDCSYRIRRDDGERWINSQAAVTYAGDGTPRTAFGVVSDITERKRSEQQVLESEMQLRLVTDAAPIGITRCDRQGRYRFVNRAFAETFARRPQQEMARLGIVDVIGDAGYHEVKPYLDQVLAGERVRFDARLSFPEIGLRQVRIDLVPDRGTDGQVIGWFAALDDITEQKDAETQLFQREREFKTLVENAPDIIGRLDNALRYVYINRAAEVAFGIEIRRFIGGTGSELGLPKEVASAIDSAARNVFESGTEQSSDIHLVSEEPQRHFIVRAMPESDRYGAVESVLIVVYDVSERVQAQFQRDRLLALEHEARRQAEAASKARDQFLAIVSHELRSPLNGIQSWTHVLEGAVSNEQTLVRRALAGIRTGVGQQVRLIEDLLDATRIMSGTLSLNRRPVPVTPAIDAAFESLKAAAADKRINVVRVIDDSEVIVDGDADRLQQVLWNLLSNAIKFTPADGNVWLTVQKAGDEVAIVVKDDGKGIAADFLPHLFEWFRREDTGSSRRQDGLGLGLALVHHLTGLMGGRIDVASAGPGLGATFMLRLPVSATRKSGIRPEPDITVATAAEIAPTLAGIRLVVVDDQRETRDALSTLLGQVGAEVFEFGSGQEAQRWIERRTLDQAPRVLICDVAMPGQDGYETLGKLRDWERAAGRPRLPAIALTAFSQREDRIRALSAGFDMHLAKPASMDELIAMILSLIR